MKNSRSNLKDYWYIYLIAVLLFSQALLFLIFRGDSYIQVHDNLDLFVPHFTALKNNGLWYAHNVDIPILHGVPRDLFGTELSLYNLMFILFPPLFAYFCGYALKIFFGIFSVYILAKDVCGKDFDKLRAPVLLSGCAYGLIPVFPAYGIAFTSIPLIIFLLRRIYLYDDKKVKKLILLYLGVFGYPFLSYFSYHGFFILAWVCISFIVLWIKDKKFPLRLLIALIVLALGYVCFEYRLFKEMLFSDTVTIRTVMVHDSLSLGGSLKAALTAFCNPAFHEQDCHGFVILPLTVIALFIVNIRYIRSGKKEQILKDPLNLIFIALLINSLIYGLYFYRPVYSLVEKLIPQLEGFNFGRTSFLNPCLWYLELAVICIRLYRFNKLNSKRWANIAAVAALLITMFMPQMYNDFYYTVYNQAYRLLKHKETTYLNYNEFYSKELFDTIKKDLDYNGEWSAAFGLHPGILDYNGFSTIDGYLGMYSLAYKEKWNEVIAPALSGSPSLAQYFNDWGARVCLYSGSDENTFSHLREVGFTDHRLMVNISALRDLNCRYILSRVELTNASELGLAAPRVYTDARSPYTIYVYSL